MIQVECEKKQIGGFCMQHINIAIPDGYIIGLIGENGAGKTTLLHLILGLYEPDIGIIRMDEKSYAESEKEIRQKIGVVLQERLFEREQTLQKNASFYGKYYENYDAKVLHHYLKKFHLDENIKYKNLSKGEELKFQLAFALAHNPKWLFLDEPTGNFDPEFRKEFLSILKDFVADGEHTVIISSHLTEELDRIADYILYLEQGRVLLYSDIETIRSQHRMISGNIQDINCIPRELLIYVEESEYGARALVHYDKQMIFEQLAVTIPTIEDLLYFISKRRKYGSKSME